MEDSNLPRTKTNPETQGSVLNIADLKAKNITELNKIARELNVPGASGMRKQDLIFQILRAQA
ncbi:MAG: Rho termination factor N-terminal domain-containing protein, partial [Nevskiales bacterium]